MKWKKLYMEAEESSDENMTKSLDEMIADYQGDEFFEEFDDVLASYGVERTGDAYDDDEGYWRFKYPVTGYWENDGIGSYEYWGFSGYDKGTDYFVSEDMDFDWDKLNDELFEKFGVRIDWNDPKGEPECEEDPECGNSQTEDGYYFVSVDDEAKLRTWLDKVVTEDTVPQELRDKALAAQKILRNNASLPDAELKSFIKRAKMMHRDELAQAAQDLLEYRNAAKNVDGDWVDRKFTGISSDFDESSNEIEDDEIEEDDDEDGWNSYYLDDSGLFDVLSEINEMEYEVKHCVRGGNTGCKTYKELGEYIVSLGERLAEAGEGVKFIS